MQDAQRVLVIEDSRSDVFLIREALESAGVVADIDVVHDGQAALRFLEEGALPALVLLDLNLPKYSGSEILRHIRNSLRTRDLVVLVVTSSALSQDREELTALGFDAYFQKPSDYEGFLKLGPIVKGLLERPLLCEPQSEP
ncbi:MAG: response regulator [Candidatus Solibacter sp.]